MISTDQDEDIIVYCVHINLIDLGEFTLLNSSIVFRNYSLFILLQFEVTGEPEPDAKAIAEAEPLAEPEAFAAKRGAGKGCKRSSSGGKGAGSCGRKRPRKPRIVKKKPTSGKSKCRCRVKRKRCPKKCPPGFVPSTTFLKMA